VRDGVTSWDDGMVPGGGGIAVPRETAPLSGCAENRGAVQTRAQNVPGNASHNCELPLSTVRVGGG